MFTCCNNDWAGRVGCLEDYFLMLDIQSLATRYHEPVVTGRFRPEKNLISVMSR